MEVSGQLYYLATSLSGKGPTIPIEIGSWLGPRASLEIAEV